MRGLRGVVMVLAGFSLAMLVPEKPTAPEVLLEQVTADTMQVTWLPSRVSQDSIGYYWVQLWINGVEQSHLYGDPTSGLGYIPAPQATGGDDFNTTGATTGLTNPAWVTMSGYFYRGRYYAYSPNSGGTGLAALNVARWLGNFTPTYQRAELTAITAPTGGTRWGVGVRLDSAGTISGYFCTSRSDSLYIVRMLNTAETTLFKKARVARANDRLRCEVQGKTLSFWVNDTLHLSGADTVLAATKYRYPGMYIKTTSMSGSAVIDNFLATELRLRTKFFTPSPRVGEQADYLLKIAAFRHAIGSQASKRATVQWRRTNQVVPDSVDAVLWVKLPKSGIAGIYVDSIRVYRRTYPGTDTLGGPLQLLYTLPPRDTSVILPYMQRGTIYGFYYTTFLLGLESAPQKLLRGKVERTWP